MTAENTIFKLIEIDEVEEYVNCGTLISKSPLHSIDRTLQFALIPFD